MIPTSATSSSPPTASVGNIGNKMNNSPNIPSSANASNGGGQVNHSAFLGIASLILEGRPLAEDEYCTQTSRVELATSLSGNSFECGRQSPKPSTSRAAFAENYSSGVCSSGSSSFSIDLANYLGRKSSNSPESTLSPSLLRDYYNSSSSESAASSVESNHSRWSQKLSQLRQESPNAHNHVLPAGQRVAVECPSGSDAEYVALAINTDHHHHHHHPGSNEERRSGDFEIIRRMSINQMNFYNSPNSSMVGGGGNSGGGVVGSSSSENFMCSLQSLASNTCLRVGNPLIVNTSSTARYSNNRIMSSSTPRFPTPHQHQHQQVDHANSSACSSSSNGGIYSPRSPNQWYPSASPSTLHVDNSNSNSNSSTINNKEYLLRKTSTTQRMAIPSTPTTNSKSNTTANTSTARYNLHSNIFSRRDNLQNSFNSSTTSNSSGTAATTMLMMTTTTTTTTSPATASSRNQTYPQQGPHCDQFLKKMGLAKGDASETEEHHCDMSYVNITCTRWRAYCIKMENILARGEPICIEVYLGPVGHKVLLEQWIITQKEKQPPPTMTLPSLCSAIRSQLYFSQISAWCDLIKKSDKTIYETGRVIYATPNTTTSAAGDLATTTTNNALATSPTTSTTSTHPTAMSSASSPLSGIVGGNGGGGGGTCVTGNLSGVSGGSGGMDIGVGNGKRRTSSPRLNIFYRIKQYDSTACFNLKPNVHNFPKVNITENCSVSVCLKSLPRITGGIPKIGTLTTQQLPQQQQPQQQQQHQQQQQQQQSTPTTGLTAPVASSTPTCLAVNSKTTAALTAAATVASVGATTLANATAVAVSATTSKLTTISTNANKPTTLIMNCDNNLKEHQQLQPQQQQQLQQQQRQTTISATSRCSFAINGGSKCKPSSSIEEDYNRDDQDVDLECEQNINLCAGGDGSGIGGGVGAGGDSSVGDCDSSNSSFSTNNYGNLSHREKQLLKYRKRMLKRDKKQQQLKMNNGLVTSIQTAITDVDTDAETANNKMEQGEDDNDDNPDSYENGGIVTDVNESAPDESCVNHIAKGQRQQLPNNCINTSQLQQHHVKMISTGTQTITNTCTSCGSEKSMICLKCNPIRSNNVVIVTGTANVNENRNLNATVIEPSYAFGEEEMDAESSSASSLSSSDIIRTPRNKAELLLQAIQRTPKSTKKHKHKSKDSNQMAAIKQQQQQQNTSISNNNHIRISPNNSSSSKMLNDSCIGVSTSNSNRNSNINININSIGIGNGNGNGNGSSGNSMVGCQVCKRQKTQHNFNQHSLDDLSSEDNSYANSSLNSSGAAVNNGSSMNKTSTDDDTAVGEGDDNDTDGGKMLSSDCVDNVSLVIDIAEDTTRFPSTKSFDNDSEIMEEEYFDSSTKLTPHIDRCSLNVKAYYNQIQRKTANGRSDCHHRSCLTPPLDEQTKTVSGAEISDGTLMMTEFRTPTPSEQHQNAVKSKAQQQPLQPHKQTPKPNLLHIACNFNKNDESEISKSNYVINVANNTPTTHNPLLLRRSLPKVNLTPIFCNPSSMMGVSSSSPIPINNGICNGSSSLKDMQVKSADINITEASPTFSFESPSSPAPSLSVQKSNSAPTLPNSPSLSPRFVKASSTYKRRSRHLSDRSDRSSLGSDEQFSDEDIDSGMYSPFATSPVKLRTRLAAVFGRKPLLGNLEECLLQRRLVPKIEVMGFKLLLGASGGFCPTQLTIPAAAYFYELKGETLSTPYLCEIRLPRKGYTVPRCGTVQATLLNPMGTVVRMFVIPYDMRDMPTLHQTFIRQRILADTGMQTNSDINQTNDDVNVGLIVDNNKHFNVAGTSATINTKLEQHHQQQQQQQQQNIQQTQRHSPQCNNDNHLGHFISAENMKSLRYSIHLRFQTSRTGRLMLHTDIRLLISRRTDCDTAAAHAKGVLEAPNELITNTVMPTNPKYSARQDQTTSKI